MNPDDEAATFAEPDDEGRTSRSPMILADRFYVPAGGSLKQGDILLGGVARLVAQDRFSPSAWDRLDSHDVTISGDPDRKDLWLEAGPALVMVTSHVCHFDKEWNIRRQALIRDGMTADEAASPDGLVPESVVDLTYRVTLDPLDIVPLASTSAESRMHLRYALACLDSLQATPWGSELHYYFTSGCELIRRARTGVLAALASPRRVLG